MASTISKQKRVIAHNDANVASFQIRQRNLISKQLLALMAERERMRLTNSKRPSPR